MAASNPTVSSQQEQNLSNTVKNLACFYNTKINLLCAENNNLREELETLKKRFAAIEFYFDHRNYEGYDRIREHMICDAKLVYNFSQASGGY